MMTLNEAIKTNKDTRAFHLLRKEHNAATAIGLGIEALKRVKRYKELHVGLHYEPLLGETEEKPTERGLPLGGIVITYQEKQKSEKGL